MHSWVFKNIYKGYNNKSTYYQYDGTSQIKISLR